MKRPFPLMLAVALLTGPGIAAEPQAALTQVADVALPAAGQAILRAGDVLIVAAGEALISLDPTSLTETGRLALTDLPLALAGRDDLDRIGLVTGTPDGRGQLALFDTGLRPMVAQPVPTGDAPRLSLTRSGQAVLALREPGDALHVHGSDARREKMPPLYEASGGLAGAWLSGRVIYLNAATEMRLMAVDLDSGVAYSDYSTSYRDGRAVMPFVVSPLLADRDCRRDGLNEFLVGDPQRHAVTLIRVDAASRSLLPVAEAGVETGTPAGRADDGMMIAASCNGLAVWVASQSGTRLKQLSIVRTGDGKDRLEEVGRVTLPSPPAAIVLDQFGSVGWIVLRDSPRILRFELDSGDELMPLPGDTTVRELQRLLTEKGYPVGAIDGILGERTRRATGLIADQTGLNTEININSPAGLSSAIETLRTAPAAGQ